MALGDNRPQLIPAAYSNVRPTPEAFGEGIGTALHGLARSTEDYANSLATLQAATKRRSDKSEDFAVENQYLKWIGAQNRAQAERLRSSSEAATGITNQTFAELQKSSEEFLANIPERLRDEYRNKLTQYTEQTATAAFNYEYQAGNEMFVRDINETLNEQAAAVLTGDISGEEAEAAVEALIARSDLPEANKRELALSSKQFLSRATFQKELEYAKDFRGQVGNADGTDVVAAGLSSYERGILNAIASEESPGYNVRYGGATFDSYDDHPRIASTITEGRNKGQKSTAAGRYMFIESTWDAEVRAYNVAHPNAPITDFSPASQDLIAIQLARKIYNRSQGPGELTFDQVLQSGNRELIKAMMPVLNADNGGWDAFRSMSPDKFANIVMGVKGIAGGGVGAPDAPDLWHDPRFASIPFEDKLKLEAQANHAVSARDTAAAQQAKAVYETGVNKIMLAAMNGEYTLNDESRLVESGALATNEDVKNFRAAVDKYEKDFGAQSKFAAALVSGSAIGPDLNDGANAFLGQRGKDAVANLDETYAAQVLLPVAKHADYMPSEFAALMDSMILGSDPNQRRYAMGIMSDLYLTNPDALAKSAGLSADAQQQITLAASLRPWYTEDQIQERLSYLRDPVHANSIRESRKEAARLFDEEIDDNFITSIFDTAFTLEPAMPLSPGQQRVLRNDMKTLFVEGMLVGQDRTAALKYAKNMANRVWRPTSIGGTTRLQKYPVELYAPSINGEYNWIDTQARSELGLAPDQSFQLVPDAQTKFEGDRYLQSPNKANLPIASYQVAVEQEDGSVGVLMDDAGRPLRWTPAITKEMQSGIERAATVSALENRKEAILGTVRTKEGYLTPENEIKLEELNRQLEELHSQAPGGNAKNIQSGASLEELKETRDRLQRILSKEPTSAREAAQRQSLEEKLNQTLISIEQKEMK